MEIGKTFPKLLAFKIGIHKFYDLVLVLLLSNNYPNYNLIYEKNKGMGIVHTNSFFYI
jgi:hypothetical protein